MKCATCNTETRHPTWLVAERTPHVSKGICPQCLISIGKVQRRLAELLGEGKTIEQLERRKALTQKRERKKPKKRGKGIEVSKKEVEEARERIKEENATKEVQQ